MLNEVVHVYGSKQEISGMPFNKGHIYFATDTKLILLDNPDSDNNRVLFGQTDTLLRLHALTDLYIELFSINLIDEPTNVTLNANDDTYVRITLLQQANSLALIKSIYLLDKILSSDLKYTNMNITINGRQYTLPLLYVDSDLTQIAFGDWNCGTLYLFLTLLAPYYIKNTLNKYVYYLSLFVYSYGLVNVLTLFGSNNIASISNVTITKNKLKKLNEQQLFYDALQIKDNGQSSLIVGNKTNKATSFGSFVSGNNNSTAGWSSHVSGLLNTISDYGRTSTALGFGNTVKEAFSHALGMYNKILHSNTHVLGIGNKTSSENQHILGTYNESATNAIHIVGGGQSNSTRKNIHTILTNGNAWFAGDVYVGSTGGKNKDAGSKKLSILGHTHDWNDITNKPNNISSYDDTLIKNRLTLILLKLSTWNGKQDILTAGKNITINNNIISAEDERKSVIYYLSESDLETLATQGYISINITNDAFFTDYLAKSIDGNIINIIIAVDADGVLMPVSSIDCLTIRMPYNDNTIVASYGITYSLANIGKLETSVKIQASDNSSLSANIARINISIVDISKDSHITNRNTVGAKTRIVRLGNVDKVVTAVMTDGNTAEWSDAQKTAAQNRIGIDTLITSIEQSINQKANTSHTHTWNLITDHPAIITSYDDTLIKNRLDQILQQLRTIIGNTDS